MDFAIDKLFFFKTGNHILLDQQIEADPDQLSFKRILPRLLHLTSGLNNEGRDDRPILFSNTKKEYEPNSN